MLRNAVFFVGAVVSVGASPHLFSNIKKCRANQNQVALTHDECSDLAVEYSLTFGSSYKDDRPAGCTRTDAGDTSPITFNSHNRGAINSDFQVYCFCSDDTTFNSDLEQCAAASSEACSLLECDDDQLREAYAATNTVDCDASPSHTSIAGGCETTGCESTDIENEWMTRAHAC